MPDNQNSSDLVERLKSAGHLYGPPHSGLLYEAAAQIERLTAPAMLNGVEVEKALDAGDPNWRAHLRPNLTGDEQLWFAVRDIAELRKWLAGEHPTLRAADNRDAAGVVERALAYLHPHLDAGAFAAPDWAIQLASILTGGDGCGAPAAVPAGEAVAARDGWAVIEAALARAVKADPADAPFGTTPAEASVWHAAQASAYQHALEMIERTPQPADGEAVAPFSHVCRFSDDSPWELTVHGKKHCEKCVPVYLHPPAPVQAAPQEGGDWHAFKNFHRSLCARFGYTHDENDWRRDLASLEEHIARMVAHPSACELGAVRDGAR